MQLTKNFSLEEMCVTNTGAHNVPNEAQTEKLLYVCSFLLQPVRERFGKIQVNSGFRSDFVNEKIGGSKTSQHKDGEAADIDPLESDYDIVFEWMKTHLVYGQLIREEPPNKKRWIHCSLPRIGGQNMQVLRFNGSAYEPIK